MAWLSLDSNDDEPNRFLAYCILALQTITPHLGQAAKSPLDFPQPVTPEHLVTSLINDLTDRHKPVLLVLDDYHFIQSQAVHEALNFWPDHAPQHFHLLITSREEPPLPSRVSSDTDQWLAKFKHRCAANLYAGFDE